jgi:hypothetical protein
MVTCTFCRIKRFKHIVSEWRFERWKKVREPPTMIERLKARIPELVMQRQSPMDARGKGEQETLIETVRSLQNRSAELQSRQ